MDERLFELCREVSEIIREKYHHTAEIIIDGNYGYTVAFEGRLLRDDEQAERFANGSIRIIDKDRFVKPL